MITSINVRAAANGYVVDVERRTGEGEAVSYSSEQYVFEKVAKLKQALKLFATDLGAPNDPPF